MILVAGILIFSIAKGGANSFEAVDDFDGEMIVYKSLSCGCCGIYGDYFKRQGNSNTKIINSQDMDSIRSRYSVPTGLQSCHTTIIGDYFVEGHIPLEAVEKLLEEKPNIAGIAMPGMPTGSPGMPGRKSGEFVIYGVEHDGSYNEFMRL